MEGGKKRRKENKKRNEMFLFSVPLDKINSNYTTINNHLRLCQRVSAHVAVGGGGREGGRISFAPSEYSNEIESCGK